MNSRMIKSNIHLSYENKTKLNSCKSRNGNVLHQPD